jgi:hypothetical protein
MRDPNRARARLVLHGTMPLELDPRNKEITCVPGSEDFEGTAWLQTA